MLSLLFVIAVIAALWLLDIELTYERNVRRGIPADFSVHRRHQPLNWKI